MLQEVVSSSKLDDLDVELPKASTKMSLGTVPLKLSIRWNAELHYNCFLFKVLSILIILMQIKSIWAHRDLGLTVFCGSTKIR